MKKTVFLFSLVVLFFSPKLLYAHGFGVHAAHLSSILALNDQYKSIIENPRFQPYFIYGSIFPDIQYAAGFKSTLQNLYQKIRATTLKEATKGWIPDNAAAFDGLTYEINTDQIPDAYPFGIDTHNDKYAFAFAEYLLQQCDPIDPPGPNPGSNGTNDAHDAKYMKIAFALGYYAHLAEDVACHDFMVPKITASLDLGDLELIKNSQSFNEDPNAQLEGIIEGIMDHYYGNNSTISDMIYNGVWVGRSQFEPTVAQMPMISGIPPLFFNGPTPTYYDGEGGWPEMNPVLLFFHSALNTWYNTNPFNLPTGVDGYKKTANSPLSATGLYQLATVFRFVNRFYPAIAGQPFNGFNSLDEVLADWVSNHLDLSNATNAYGIALSYFTAGFAGVLLAQEMNVSMLSGLAYPKILDQFSSDLSNDARSLVGLMLSDMAKADELANKYPDRINIASYDKLKASALFTNPTGLLGSLWTEYKGLGTKVYREVGPSGKWYSDWSPWHKQSMAWGVLSSLNKSIPDIYTSNQNVAVYDAYFDVNNSRITGPQLPEIFQNNPVVKTKIELYNTSNVPSESVTLRVKKDHSSSDYSLDPLKTSTTFSIDQDPLLYNTTDRKKVELVVPSVSLSVLTDYRGYYMEAVNNSNNKAMFTSSFEQYQERLDLTPNYSKLYGSYEQGKWPVSLGLLRSVASVNLNTAQFPEGGGTGGYYKINGVTQNSITGCVDDYINLEAVPPTGWFFSGWSDGNIENPRNYRISSTTVNLSAIYKGHLLSNNTTGFSSNSQRKFISDVNGYKHLVYESQGSVWYTKSTDNGTTWQQEVKLNEDGTQAKGIVAATSSNGYLYLLYQCDYDTSGNPNPSLILSQYYGGNFRWRTNVCYLSSFTYNTMPVVSAINGVVMVVYNPGAASGLVGVEYYLNIGNIAETHVRNIPGTTQYSTNPALAVTDQGNMSKHMLVYQESYYGIYYKQWTVATNFANLVTSNLTSGVGYSLNYTPSIVNAMTGSRLCWVGSNYSGTSKRVVFRDPDNLYQFWTFGNSVSSPSINRTNDYTACFVGWSDGNGSSFKIVDSHLSYDYIKTLTGLQGSAMQISNGGSANTMHAMTFYNGGLLPYALTQSNSLASYYSLSKENTNSNIASGRAGIVMKDEGEFSFMLGDIEVNDEKIRFKKLSDTLTIPSKDVFNTLVESEPFELNENSDFTYSVEYGVTDSTLAAQALQNGENVKFKVELVDAVTNQIINTFDNVTYTKDFLQQYNSLAYQVNTEAIGTMNVKLRLVADHSGEAKYLINNSFVEDEIIAKKGFKVINLKNELQIKDYALAQNYPNPFNPATTITYQLPKSGSVTLKIFDILGNEVKTLVNENKEMGRYTVQFDASSLASGMYVYQLRANDYTSTKKMLLLK